MKLHKAAGFGLNTISVILLTGIQPLSDCLLQQNILKISLTERVIHWKSICLYCCENTRAWLIYNGNLWLVGQQNHKSGTGVIKNARLRVKTLCCTHEKYDTVNKWIFSRLYTCHMSVKPVLCPRCYWCGTSGLLWCLMSSVISPSCPPCSPPSPVGVSGNWTAVVGWRVGTEINTWWRPATAQTHWLWFTHKCIYTFVSDNINTLNFLPSPVAVGGNPELYNRDMAGLLCGTKRKKQGKLVLIIVTEELVNGNGEAGQILSALWLKICCEKSLWHVLYIIKVCIINVAVIFLNWWKKICLSFSINVL